MLGTLALAFQLQLPAPVGYVNDFARAVNPAAARAMAAVGEEVRRKCGGEIVVVTLADLGGRPAIEVARDIGREWGVGARGAAGDPRRNTGVVLLLKPGGRPGDGRAELAIATGSGAEGFITDALAGRIRDEIGRVAVQEGSYGAGLVAGVEALAAAYAREFGFALDGESAPRRRTAPERRPDGFPWGAIILFAIVVLMGGVGGRRGRWGRRRGGVAEALLWGALLGGGRRGGGAGGGGGGGGGFGGFGGGGGFSGGGASGRF